MSVDAYTPVALRCKANLFGNVQIFWEKSGSAQLPKTASVNSITLHAHSEIISVLSITKALNYYSGDYYCIVKNEIGETRSLPAHIQVKGTYHRLAIYRNSSRYSYICEKTEQDVTFDIIYMYIYIYLRPSRLCYWFNKWLKQLWITSIKPLEIHTLKVCAC